MRQFAQSIIEQLLLRWWQWWNKVTFLFKCRNFTFQLIILIMSFSAHNENSSDVSQTVFSAINTFLQKLKNDEWLSNISKGDIKSCLQSAKKIETMLQSVETNNSLDCFAGEAPKLCGFEVDQLFKACDIVLSVILTAPGVSLPCVRICFDEYFQLCGPERFEHVVSSVIFCSEIYRVLLDYLASSECDLGHAKLNLQSHLLVRAFKNETDVETLQCTLRDWVNADPSGHHVAVALMVISFEDLCSIISICLVQLLTGVLEKREDLALAFWKILALQPSSRRALQISNELLNSALTFLKTTAQWMEATATLSWVSREKSSCKAFGFDELVTAVKSLLETKGTVQEQTEKFLLKRKKSVGCTLWEDVEMQLII